MTFTTRLLAGTGLLALSLSASATQVYGTQFKTLNDSGVNGSAMLTYDDMANTLEVAVNATGLVPNMKHAMHIHG